MHVCGENIKIINLDLKLFRRIWYALCMKLSGLSRVEYLGVLTAGIHVQILTFKNTAHEAISFETVN